MDAVNGEPLDQVAEGDDEMARPLGGNDGGDDAAIVCLLILHLLLFAKEFFDDVRVIARKFLAHARTGVFGGDAPVHPYQAVDGRLVPVVQVLLRRFDAGKFFRRIVDERGKGLLFLHGKGALELLLDLLADGARAVFQNVQKGLVLAVDVCDKVLRPLGKVEHRRKVDDLRCRRRRRRELHREPFKIFSVLHICSPCLRLYRKRARIAIPVENNFANGPPSEEKSPRGGCRGGAVFPVIRPRANHP